MFRILAASTIVFCTFFISRVDATSAVKVNVPEMMDATWGLAEVSEQMALVADSDGLSGLAEAADALRQEAADRYVDVRRLGVETQALTVEDLPAATDEMEIAFDEVAAQMALLDDESAVVRTLWRVMQTRMKTLSRVAAAR